MAKHDIALESELQRNIDELDRTIITLEDHRSRLVDLAPRWGEDETTADGSLWTDIREVFEDLMELMTERAKESAGLAGEGDAQDAAEMELRRDVSKTVNRIWKGATSRGRGRKADGIDRAAFDNMLAGLDAEIATLRADKQMKADELAAAQAASEVAEREVTEDRTVVSPPDPVVIDVVEPPPVDVIPAVVPDVVPPTPVEEVVINVVDDGTVDPNIQPAEQAPFEPGVQVEMGEFDGAIYDVNELIARGVSVADLRRADVPAGVLRSSGLAATDLLAAGYTAMELREGMYPADELVAQVSAASLRDAGYSAFELNGVGVDWATLAAAGFVIDDLRNAGADEESLRALFPQDFAAEDDTTGPSYNWSTQ